MEKMRDILLEKMFEYNNWQKLIDKADEKGIDLALLNQLTQPTERLKLYAILKSGNYHIAPPHVILIPKDKPGEFRECKANEPLDRIVLTLINDCLMDLFPSMIHPACKSYQKGIGCAEVVQKSVAQISKLPFGTWYKADLSKYFDSVNIEWIDWVFDRIETQLGFRIGTEPVINTLREYYHSDWLIDTEGNLVQKYTSLKQGCAVASFLADVILYQIDEKMSQICDFYVRYSDDILLIGRNATQAKEVLEEMLTHYGLKLNPKKVETIDANHWFTFLGFSLLIGKQKITLSHNRIKKLQKEITSRTIDDYKATANSAKNSLINYMYKGDYNWATSCFSIINCKEDIDEINKFIMDCLRACEVRDRYRKIHHKAYKIGINKIGGLGSVQNLPDKTIIRGKGKNVTANRNKTEKEISHYKSVGCLVIDYQMSKGLFEAVIRGM